MFFYRANSFVYACEAILQMILKKRSSYIIIHSADIMSKKVTKSYTGWLTRLDSITMIQYKYGWIVVRRKLPLGIVCAEQRLAGRWFFRPVPSNEKIAHIMELVYHFEKENCIIVFRVQYVDLFILENLFFRKEMTAIERVKSVSVFSLYLFPYPSLLTLLITRSVFKD